jgi:hypothetical protein
MKNNTNKTTYILLIMGLLALQMLCASTLAADLTYNQDSASMILVNLVSQDPDPALAGETFDVRLGIQNNGGAQANKVTIELVPTYPFELVSGEKSIKEIGTLQGYQSGDDLQIVKFALKIDKDATAGSYSLKIRQQNDDGTSNITVEKTFSIDVKSRTSAEVVQIDKTTLIPGRQTPIKFKITNVGNAPLKDMTFSWSNSDKVILPVGSDNTKYVKYLDAGASVELEYQVIADSSVSAGIYELSLNLAYTDSINNSAKTISTIAGVYVGGGTDFDVAFSESAGTTTAFTIANIGSNPATSVSVIVPQQQGWQVNGANAVIIGNLNTGDYTVASFALTKTVQTASASQAAPQTNTLGIAGPGNAPAAGNATTANMTPQMIGQRSSQNNLNIQIAYTDTMGTRNTIEKTVVMSQSSTNSTGTFAGMPMGAPSFRRASQQSAFSKYKWYIAAFLGLAIILALIMMRTKYKREKLINPGFKVKDLFKKSSPGKKR